MSGLESHETKTSSSTRNTNYIIVLQSRRVTLGMVLRPDLLGLGDKALILALERLKFQRSLIAVTMDFNVIQMTLPFQRPLPTFQSFRNTIFHIPTGRAEGSQLFPSGSLFDTLGGQGSVSPLLCFR
ncbi:hypothetical protein RRG08_005328 [Elysia crispata]|uniref:Uncharacterized protein n=1 Tax=Elysia crispata TaxID=231223 RepID=A0AAE0YVQ9_9GAST|nr:hypothetical protein RRG08_005328 [Elysia crispata]